jgi:hypothetical protein
MDDVDPSVVKEAESSRDDAVDDPDMTEIASITTSLLNNISAFYSAPGKARSLFYNMQDGTEGLNQWRPRFVMITGSSFPDFKLTKDELELLTPWAQYCRRHGTERKFPVVIDQQRWTDFCTKAKQGWLFHLHCEAILMLCIRYASQSFPFLPLCPPKRCHHEDFRCGLLHALQSDGALLTALKVGLVR